MSDPTSTTPALGDFWDTLKLGFGGDIDVSEDASSPELTGLHTGSAEVMDLSSYTGESLTDLSWLDPTQLQDPERLPKSPTDQMIPELVEAWGRRTDGQTITAARDLTRARYEDSLSSPLVTQPVSSDLLRPVVAKAMRRSAAGEDIHTILNQTLGSVGKAAGQIAPALRAVRAEHGLAGNVFIRASAYPGYASGKWSTHLRRYANGAQYVLVTAQELRDATWIRDGRCLFTSKKAVTEVPWDEAYAYYAPRLAAVGKKIASTKTHKKQALQKAFLSVSEKEARESLFPTQVAQGDRVSTSEARAAFESYVPEARKVFDPAGKRAQEKDAAVLAQLSRWHTQGLLSKRAHDAIASAPTSSDAKVAAALSLLKLLHKRGFQGSANQALVGERALRAARSERAAEASQKRAEEVPRALAAREAATLEALSQKQEAALVKALDTASAWLRKSDFGGVPNAAHEKNLEVRANQAGDRTRASIQKASDVEAELQNRALLSSLEVRPEQQRVARVQEACKKVAHAIDAGLRGYRLADEIRRLIPEADAKLASRYLDQLLKKSGALTEPPAKAKTYNGVQFQRNASSPVSPSQGERVGVLPALRWARQVMSEGFAGKNLDDLIQNRFASRVRDAMAPELRELRAQHEGGSGFLYVDAEAYASPTGITGCEKGAAKHRTNSIRSVRAMDRCNDCALASVLEDGTRRCSAYNKTLVEDVSGPDLQALRASNIRAAGMNDAELTASFFAPVHDPAEFGLGNEALEDIEVPFPETPNMSAITFGGWDL